MPRKKYPEYPVEKIVERKKHKGAFLYRVRWKGYPAGSDTWEPRRNLEGISTMVEFNTFKDNSKPHVKTKRRFVYAKLRARAEAERDAAEKAEEEAEKKKAEAAKQSEDAEGGENGTADKENLQEEEEAENEEDAEVAGDEEEDMGEGEEEAKDAEVEKEEVEEEGVGEEGMDKEEEDESSMLATDRMALDVMDDEAKTEANLFNETEENSAHQTAGDESLETDKSVEGADASGLNILAEDSASQLLQESGQADDSAFLGVTLADPDKGHCPMTPPRGQDLTESTLSVSPCSASSMLHISKEDLQRRVTSLEKHLKGIASGEVPSDRHTLYLKGDTVSMGLLDKRMGLHLLPENQEDIVMDLLMSMFPVSKMKDMDYILRVLLPETLIQVYNQVEKNSDCLKTHDAGEMECGQSFDDIGDQEEELDSDSMMNDDDNDPDYKISGSDLSDSEPHNDFQARIQADLQARSQAKVTSTSTTAPTSAHEKKRRRIRTSCRKRQRKESSKRWRKKCPCPVSGCDGETQYLKRHIKQVHKDIPDHEIQGLVKRQKKSKRKLYVWKCVEKGCMWQGDRLDKHLASKKHSMNQRQAKAAATIVRQQQSFCGSPVHKRANDQVNCDSLAGDFLAWYSSIEGGNFVPDFLEDHKKRERVDQNKKVTQMVKTVLLCAFGEDDFSVSQLADLVNIGRNSPSVITKLAESRTWGTVRNYLHAFSHFLAFMESCFPLALSPATLNAIKANLKGCIRTVVKLSQEQLQKRKVVDRNRLLNWPDLCNYVDAKLAETNMEMFKSLDQKEKKKEVAEKIAKHLLLQIAIQNGKRTGIYADVTVQQFEQADEEGDGYVMLVDEGKTFRVSGCAGIFLSKDEYSLLSEFVQKCRPVFHPENDQLFCRPSGKRSNVKDIQNFLQESWDDFGNTVNRNLGKITCSLLRKTLVSRSRKIGLDRSEQEQMARHMDHSLSTADRHYDVNTGIRITAKFRQIIQKLGESELPSESEDSSEDFDGDQDLFIEPPESVSVPLASLDQSVVSATSSLSGHDEQPVDKSLKFGREVVFSETDSCRLKRCCARVIQFGIAKRGVVTKNMIISAVKSAGPNFVDLLLNYSDNQICSKVRTEIRKRSA